MRILKEKPFKGLSNSGKQKNKPSKFRVKKFSKKMFVVAFSYEAYMNGIHGGAMLWYRLTIVLLWLPAIRFVTYAATSIAAQNLCFRIQP